MKDYWFQVVGLCWAPLWGPQERQEERSTSLVFVIMSSTIQRDITFFFTTFVFSQEFSSSLLSFFGTLFGNFYQTWKSLHVIRRATPVFASQETFSTWPHSTPVARKSVTTTGSLLDDTSSEQSTNRFLVTSLPAFCQPLFWCSGLWWSEVIVPCWVTILLGKWNLDLSTGQEDPTSPEAKFIQAFLCGVQMPWNT